jgi:ElaB/YqjD/DUF883 family membrane-anchored ribosome-binding protein
MVRSEPINASTADIQALKDDLARLRDDVSNIANAWVTRGRDRVQSAAGTLQDGLRSSLDNVHGFVRERPVQTIIVAGVIGLIIGRLLRR